VAKAVQEWITAIGAKTAYIEPAQGKTATGSAGHADACSGQRFHRGYRSSLHRTRFDIRRREIQSIQVKVVGGCTAIGGKESKHEHLPGRQAGTVHAFLILLSAGGR
jgi:hypothetical protein